MSFQAASSLITPSSALLGPVIGLNAWTFAMETWMYATRLRWIIGAKPKLSNATTRAQFEAAQPAEVRWIADNYNHLFEQPTQFYAVALTLAVMGADSTVDRALAWGYVGGRVVHSFVQCLGNNIPVRLQLYWLNSFILAGLTARAGMMLLDKSR